MHKMTRATAIPPNVKEIVFDRDDHRCILCYSNQGVPNAHVVRRSQGGMGVEQNIVTLCPCCHREFDEGKNAGQLYGEIVAHLKQFYPDWTREQVVYRKWQANTLCQR